MPFSFGSLEEWAGSIGIANRIVAPGTIHRGPPGQGDICGAGPATAKDPNKGVWQFPAGGART